MSHQLFNYSFNIEANIPQGLFEAFMAAQAKLLGIRGTMAKTAEGYKGNLEADKETIEKIKNIIEKSEEFVSKITTVIFTELKEIKEHTIDNFSIKIEKLN